MPEIVQNQNLKVAQELCQCGVAITIAPHIRMKLAALDDMMLNVYQYGVALKSISKTMTAR